MIQTAGLDRRVAERDDVRGAVHEQQVADQQDRDRASSAPTPRAAPRSLRSSRHRTRHRGAPGSSPPPGRRLRPRRGARSAGAVPRPQEGWCPGRGGGPVGGVNDLMVRRSAPLDRSRVGVGLRLDAGHRGGGPGGPSWRRRHAQRDPFGDDLGSSNGGRPLRATVHQVAPGLPGAGTGTGGRAPGRTRSGRRGRRHERAPGRAPPGPSAARNVARGRKGGHLRLAAGRVVRRAATDAPRHRRRAARIVRGRRRPHGASGQPRSADWALGAASYCRPASVGSAATRAPARTAPARRRSRRNALVAGRADARRAAGAGGSAAIGTGGSAEMRPTCPPGGGPGRGTRGRTIRLAGPAPQRPVALAASARPRPRRRAPG